MAFDQTDVKLTMSGDNKKLKRTLTDSERAAVRFEKKALSGFGKLRAGLNNSSFAKGLTRPFVGLLATGAVIAAGKQIVDFDSKLARLAIQGSITAEEQIKLRKEIIETANATGQSWDKMLGGSDAIVQRLGDLGLARDLMKDLGITATATGAPIEELGALASNLYDKIKISKEDMFAALNSLTAQGKMGAFTLQDMAAQGERLFAAAGRFDIKGMEKFKKFGAMVQIARKGTGSSEQATTAVERMLSDIISKHKKIKSLFKMDIFTDKSRKNLKDMEEIIKGIITGADGDQTKLQKIFGRESIRGISALVDHYKETGGFALFDDLASADAKQGAVLMEDFARYSKEAAPQLQRVANIARKFSDHTLSPGIRRIAEGLESITSDPERMERHSRGMDTLGGAVSFVGRGAVMAAEGWFMLFDALDKMIESGLASKAGQRLIESWNDVEASRSDFDEQNYKYLLKKFKKLPGSDKRQLSKEFDIWGQNGIGNRQAALVQALAAYQSNTTSNSNGAVPNNVEVTVNVSSDGTVSAEAKSDPGQARPRITVNRGTSPLARK